MSEQAFLRATPSEPPSEQAFLHETQSNFSLPRTPKRQCTESEPVTPERKRELLQRRAVKDEFTREEIERDPLYAEETIRILQEEAHQHRHERFLLRGLSVVRMRNRSRSPAVIRPSMALRLRSEEVDNERLKTKHMSEALEYAEHLSEEESEVYIRTVESLYDQLDQAHEMTSRLGEQVFNEQKQAHDEEIEAQQARQALSSSSRGYEQSIRNSHERHAKERKDLEEQLKQAQETHTKKQEEASSEEAYLRARLECTLHDLKKAGGPQLEKHTEEKEELEEHAADGPV